MFLCLIQVQAVLYTVIQLLPIIGFMAPLLSKLQMVSAATQIHETQVYGESIW